MKYVIYWDLEYSYQYYTGFAIDGNVNSSQEDQKKIDQVTRLLKRASEAEHKDHQKYNSSQLMVK